LIRLAGGRIPSSAGEYKCHEDTGTTSRNL
jgi:hypothetical protein